LGGISVYAWIRALYMYLITLAAVRL